jgi:hypothetical protein
MPLLKPILELPLHLRQRKLASARAPLGKQEFIDAAASTELGRAAAGLLWDKLQKLKVHDEFTPYPSDDLLRTFGLAEQDLDVDVIIDIAKTLDRAVPDQTIVDAVGVVATLADVVRLIEATRASVEDGNSAAT